MSHRYEDMFVPVPVTFLRQLREQHQEEVGVIAETYVSLGAPPVRRLPARKAMAISLCCTDRMNRYADEFPLQEKALSKWNRLYRFNSFGIITPDLTTSRPEVRLRGIAEGARAISVQHSSQNASQDDTKKRLAAELAALQHRLAALEVARGKPVTAVSPSQADTTPPALEFAREPRPAGEIFVSIASSGEPDLPRILDECLHQAMYPEALRLGLYCPHNPDQPVELDRFRRDARVQIADAGPDLPGSRAWARAMAQRFWSGEPYTLHIDTPVRFAPGWDVKLVQMLERLPGKKPLITASASHATNRPTRPATPGDRPLAWPLPGAEGTASPLQPTRARFITGQFVFTRGQWIREVSHDTDQDDETADVDLTLRSYTHGYDFFSPSESVVWPTTPGDHPVQPLMGMADPAVRDAIQQGPFGLGQMRTVQDYEIYAGIDLTRQKAHPDVFVGHPPNPVTILAAPDWERDLTLDAFRNLSQALGVVTAFAYHDPPRFDAPFAVFPSTLDEADLPEAFWHPDAAPGRAIRPQRRAHVAEHHIEGALMLCPALGNTAFSLNHALHQTIWEQCDGKRTIRDIYQQLRLSAEPHTDIGYAEMVTLLFRLCDLGVLTLEGLTALDMRPTRQLELRDFTFYVVTGQTDETTCAVMTQQLRERGLTFEIVKCVACAPPRLEGALAHLRLLQRPDVQVPFAIVDDTCQWTEAFRHAVTLPAHADALCLGVSCLGLRRPGAWSWPGWNHTRFVPYDDDHVRVFNMAARHAVVYLSETFQRHATAALLQALTHPAHPYPAAVAYALLQISHLVLASNNPMCYQSERYTPYAPATQHPLRHLLTTQAAERAS